jgi:RimJ/RimL family protein N-acetyltransferase
VRRWWDDGVHVPYPDAVLENYRDALRGADPTYHYIARLDERPAGMFQHYLIGDHDEYAAALALGERAVGVDLFIGEPDLIGHGHGPAMLRGFLRDVAFPFHGIDLCVIGPSVSNAAAIRAYEKAGFTRLREVQVPGEPEPELLMRMARAEVDSARA